MKAPSIKERVSAIVHKKLSKKKERISKSDGALPGLKDDSQTSFSEFNLITSNNRNATRLSSIPEESEETHYRAAQSFSDYSSLQSVALSNNNSSTSIARWDLAAQDKYFLKSIEKIIIAKIKNNNEVYDEEHLTLLNGLLDYGILDARDENFKSSLIKSRFDLNDSVAVTALLKKWPSLVNHQYGDEKRTLLQIASLALKLEMVATLRACKASGLAVDGDGKTLWDLLKEKSQKEGLTDTEKQKLSDIEKQLPEQQKDVRPKILSRGKSETTISGSNRNLSKNKIN